MRLTLIPAAVVLSVLALAGCSAGSLSLVEPAVVTHDMAESAPQAFSDAGARAADENRQVIVTGRLNLTVEHPAEAASDVAAIVERAAGRVDARSERAPRGEDKGSAELTVRIPTPKLTATLDALKELGEVEDVDQQKRDVTTEVQDLESRIKALQASVDRLIALMADADTTADLISIESALSERQANLESLQAQKRSLDNLVEMTTYTVHLGTERDAPIHEPDTFLSGLAAGWDAFVGFFSFLLVAFGVLLPWLALFAILALVIVFLVRRRSRPASAVDGVEGL